MWFSYKYFIVNELHSLDERDSPSKLRVSTPALLYKALPQSYQDVDMMYDLVLLVIDLDTV